MELSIDELIERLRGIQKVVPVRARLRVASRAREWTIKSVCPTIDGKDVIVEIAPRRDEYAE